MEVLLVATFNPTIELNNYQKMKKLHIMVYLAVFAVLLCLPQNAQAQLDTPRGSQHASVAQTVGITKMYVHYSRPSVRGREIWGKLVPYGMNNLGFGTAKESPWRAGADENTVFKVTSDVTVGGNTLPAGGGSGPERHPPSPPDPGHG